MKIKSWLTRLPKGCIFSHFTLGGESYYERYDSRGLLHCYVKYHNGMVHHWISDDNI